MSNLFYFICDLFYYLFYVMAFLGQVVHKHNLGSDLQKEPRIETLKYHILLVGEKEKTVRESLLTWFYPAGTVTVIPIEQSKVTLLKREIGKGWQNSSITTEL
jgi:hypothetical protein